MGFGGGQLPLLQVRKPGHLHVRDDEARTLPLRESCRKLDGNLQSPAAQDTLLSSSPVTHSSVIPLDFVVSSPLTCGTLSSWIERTPSSAVRGTPMRQRPDLGSAQNGLQVDFQYEPAIEDRVASEQFLGQKLLI